MIQGMPGPDRRCAVTIFAPPRCRSRPSSALSVKPRAPAARLRCQPIVRHKDPTMTGGFQAQSHDSRFTGPPGIHANRFGLGQAHPQHSWHHDGGLCLRPDRADAGQAEQTNCKAQIAAVVKACVRVTTFIGVAQIMAAQSSSCRARYGARIHHHRHSSHRHRAGYGYGFLMSDAQSPQVSDKASLGHRSSGDRLSDV